jgi:hypothetical protein
VRPRAERPAAAALVIGDALAGEGLRRGHRAYTFLVTARYVSHTGERPIAITWRLDDPMPESVYAMARVAAA